MNGNLQRLYMTVELLEKLRREAGSADDILFLAYELGVSRYFLHLKEPSESTQNSN